MKLIVPAVQTRGDLAYPFAILFGSYANYYNVDAHKMDLARVIVLWRSLNVTGAGNAAEALVIS